MALDAKNLNAFAVITGMKSLMSERLQERLESGELFPRLEEGLSSYEAQRLRVGTVDPKTKSIHKDAFNTAKRHFLSGHSIDDAIKKAKEKHGLNEEIEIGEAEAIVENIRKDTIDADFSDMSQAEKDAVLRLKSNGKFLGSDEGAYASGVLLLTFKNKQAVNDFAEGLETDPDVDTYEIEAVREDLVHGFVEDEEYDFDDVMFDKDFEFNVFVYLNTDIVLSPAEELEVDEDFEYDDENGFLSEVRRKIKVNFRGKKRIKMQCSPGFKWVASVRTCKKISGSQIAVMRKAMRRAVLTKKSMGQSFKARVLRKSRKAKRFRKGFGLR